MENRQNPTIKISKKLKNKLDNLGKKGDTYEEIIWKLINLKNRRLISNE